MHYSVMNIDPKHSSPETILSLNDKQSTIKNSSEKFYSAASHDIHFCEAQSLTWSLQCHSKAPAGRLQLIGLVEDPDAQHPSSRSGLTGSSLSDLCLRRALFVQRRTLIRKSPI